MNFLNEVVNFGLDMLLPPGYSYTKLWRVVFGLDEVKEKRISAEEQEHYKRLFSATLTRLQCKGYVIKEKDGNKFHWKLTETGEAAWSARNFTLLPEDGIARLFVFDIPEKQRDYRDWIRAELVASGYRLLQKSVWLGERPLRKQFLNEVLERNLFEFIHFFEVREAGTLTNSQKE